MAVILDLMGQKFGRLTVIGKADPVDNKYKRVSWECYCDCGNTVTKEARQLRFQMYPNCGCINDYAKTITASKYVVRYGEDNINPIAVAEEFPDYDKFVLISRAVRFNMSDKDNWFNFIRRFYNDEQFNKVYEFWQKQPRLNTFYDFAKPSIDHKMPVAKGGDDSLDNLHFVTMFENYAKRDMTWEEWCQFKKDTNSTSDYYLESIMED